MEWIFQKDPMGRGLQGQESLPYYTKENGHGKH
jgi:hypothetical protein